MKYSRQSLREAFIRGYKMGLKRLNEEVETDLPNAIKKSLDRIFRQYKAQDAVEDLVEQMLDNTFIDNVEDDKALARDIAKIAKDMQGAGGWYCCNLLGDAIEAWTKARQKQLSPFLAEEKFTRSLKFIQGTLYTNYCLVVGKLSKTWGLLEYSGQGDLIPSHA